MTSHYLGCVVKSSFETIFEALRTAFGNVYSKEFSEVGEPHIGIILGEKFFLRVRSDVAVLVVLKEISSDETNIEVISCAGGESAWRISYAAHPAYVHDVKKFLTKSGFKIDSEKEIPYFERYRTVPTDAKAFLKRCIRCGEEIPIASEKCQYCGIEQPG